MKYAIAHGELADFEVRYCFYTQEEGGRRSSPPWSNYRCDWAYEGDDITQTGIYMIWPEFLGEGGSVQPEGTPVTWSGLANMWIVSPEMRAKFHRVRLREGVRGYFMEGSHRAAEAVVTRILGLQDNPDSRRKIAR